MYIKQAKKVHMTNVKDMPRTNDIVMM